MITERQEAQSVRLSEYTPISRLEVKHTAVPRPKYPAFDFHMHFGSLLLGDDYAGKYDMGQVVSTLKENGVTGAVNLDGFYGDSLDRMLDKVGEHRNFVHTFGSVDLDRFEEPNFETYVYKTIRDGKSKGIEGLKFWKILGLSVQDRQGAYLRPDDPRLACIWQCAAEEALPVLIHLADPVAFFQPTDHRNERYEELGAHPDWSFAHEKYYRFGDLMEMQERLIAGNPKTTFVVAHVGSHAENLEAVSRWLDAYPNMNVDIADRIAELGRQPYSCKAFIEKYADRVFFGTDSTPLNLRNYPAYYQFLETLDEYFPYDVGAAAPRQGRWNIYGLGLSDGALQKIYAGNAKRLLPHL